jgi:hypothetical protein
MFKQIIFFEILTTNTLGVNVYKMFKCDKNQVSIPMFKMNFLKFLAIDRIWPTLDKLYYFYLHMLEKIKF